MLKSIYTIIFSVFSLGLYASCFNPTYTITEILNHDPDSHHIFSCKIIHSFPLRIGFESMAIITHRYRGNPYDTVYINTGGGTTAGGGKIMPGTEWLIFSTTKDNIHYGATVCDALSTRLADDPNLECGRKANEFSKIYPDILRQYEIIKKEKYTGTKSIYGNGKLVAAGEFKNGLPHGKWTHYSPRHFFENNNPRSIINYFEGRLDGEYIIFDKNVDYQLITEKRIYKNGLPVKKEIPISGIKNTYNYFTENKREKSTEWHDTSGTLTLKSKLIEIDFNHPQYQKIWYHDGYYFNKSQTYSTHIHPLGEGHYKKGARVGKWTFFNKKGETIKTEKYPDIPRENENFIVYDDYGKIKISGSYENGIRTGIWKYFYDEKLEYHETYNSNGERTSRTHHYTSGGGKYTPYKNGKIHGQKIIYDGDGTVREIENYKNGIKEGTSISFNNDGSIEKEINYIKGRAFSVFPNEKEARYVNGYLNGHSVHYHLKTNKKSYEGELWNGHQIGVWTTYEKDGSYVKSYYPRKEELLASPCANSYFPMKTEFYDQNGELTNTWTNDQ